MDPVSLIVAALVAGAASGGTEAAASAVRDGYAGLKGLLAGLLQRTDPAAADAQLATLEEHAQHPGALRGPVEQALRSAGADQDPQVLAAARELLRNADPGGVVAKQYNVDLRDAKGVQVGDGNTQTINFN